MNDSKSPFKSLAYNYGLYLALISILTAVLIYALNLDPENITISIVTTLLTIAVYFFGLSALKKAQHGFMSLGEAIKLGLAIAVVGGVFAAVYGYIHYTFIYPEFIEIVRENALMEMQERATGASSAELEQGMKMTEMFTSPLAMSLFSIVGSLIFGLIISLILGLIMKKTQE
jgi:hypothetical protein